MSNACCFDINRIVAFSEWQSWEVGLHRIAVKLQKALARGLIVEDHIMLQLLEDGLDRALETKPSGTFSWRPAVRSFWEVILFHFGQSGVRLMRGPGLHGLVPDKRQGIDRTKLKLDRQNLPGPGLKTLIDGLPDGTRSAGIGRDALVNVGTIVFDPARQNVALVANKTVTVHAGAAASDAMQIKPQLQVDLRNGTVVGMKTGGLDVKTVRDNPVLQAAEFKRDVITEVLQIQLLSMTCDISLPVGSLLKTKRSTGQQWRQDFTEIVTHLAMCMHCARTATNIRDHVFFGESQCITTPCSDCDRDKAVCSACVEMGHGHWEVALRACDSCIRDRRLCQRFAVLMLPADCESYQNTGMELWLKRQQESPENTLYSLTRPAPEEVHIGKRVRSSIKNYWLLLDGQRVNLQILAAMRDEGSSGTRKKWQSILPASATLNKDMMDVDSVLHQSSVGVRNELSRLKAVVVEIIPHRKGFHTGNRPDNFLAPNSICAADFGFIAFTDCGKGILFIADNHSPVNVSVMAKNLDRPDCVTYGEGLLMFAETGDRRRLLCIDLSGNHVLVPGSMKVAQLRDACKTRDIDMSGKKADLAARLQKWLDEHAGAAMPHGGVDEHEREANSEREPKEAPPWAKQKHKPRPARPVHTVALHGVPDGSVIRALLMDPTGKRLIMSTITANNAGPAILEIALTFDGRIVSGTAIKTVPLQLGLRVTVCVSIIFLFVQAVSFEALLGVTQAYCFQTCRRVAVFFHLIWQANAHRQAPSCEMGLEILLHRQYRRIRWSVMAKTCS